MQLPKIVSTDKPIEEPNRALILRWLQSRLAESDYGWLCSQLDKVAASNSDRDLHVALGLIPRKLGRIDLNLNSFELSAAEQQIPGWRPVNWTVDIAARVLVLCHLTDRGKESFGELIVDLCRTADLAESIAIYSGLPLYPYSKALDQQVSEGLRSNIKAVFEAIAHNNPYPANYFDKNRWNHMVLKALFVESWLSPIAGLDDKANHELAIKLCDYAHERWAAAREISYELWRCVGPFATNEMIQDLEKVVVSGKIIEKHAALLALSQNNSPRAQRIVENYPAIHHKIDNGELSWRTIEAVTSLAPNTTHTEQSS